jgi:hypothetical protein
MMKTYFHGGAQVYKRLLPGTGIDGDGIYLTSSRKRAEMYSRSAPQTAQAASRPVFGDAHGRERKPHLTEVGVDVEKAKIWDDDAEVDLRDFAAKTDASWIAEMLAQHGPRVTLMNGQNARVYLGWVKDRSNGELKRRGFQAIKRGSDLVVLDPGIIEYSVRIV